MITSDVRGVKDGNLMFSKSLHPRIQWDAWGAQEPYDWQANIWDACWNDGRWVSACTANEAGKSAYLIPLLALSFCCAFPGAAVAITSGSERQLEDQVWRGLRAFILGRKGWRHAGDHIYGPSIDGLPPCYIRKFATKDALTAEGFHKDVRIDKNGKKRMLPLLYIIDEAKNVKSGIFTAANRCNPNVCLVISTTGEASGPFYDTRVNKDGNWITKWKGQDLIVDWTMCPHLQYGHTYEKKKRMLDSRGRDDPDVKSILLAQFFRAGTYMVFNDEDIQNVRTCMSGMVPKMGHERRAACDLSGGVDEQTFYVREGNTVTHQDHVHITDSPSLINFYARKFEEHTLKPHQISMDLGGPHGSLIIKGLEERGYLGINRYHANFKPKDLATYKNCYAEDHWRLKQLFFNKMIALPSDSILLEQMSRRQYIKRNDDSNRVAMEPKEEARRQRQENSPDRLDTLVMLFRDKEVVRADEFIQMHELRKTPSLKECLISHGGKEESSEGCGWMGDVM